MSFSTGIMLGLMAGAAGISALISYRIDMYHERIMYLETVINDKDVKLNKLEESMNNAKNKNKFILKDIEIVLAFDGEDSKIDKLKIEEHVKGRLKDLLGKEVKNIDADLISAAIDKTIFKIEGRDYSREYTLKLSRLVLSEILKLWVEVEASA